MVEWSAPDIKRFKKYARPLHQQFAGLLGGSWHLIEDNDWRSLRRKVGFAVYGPPHRTPRPDNNNTGYGRAQRKVIEKICDQLADNLPFDTETISFSCIFVIIKIYGNRYIEPVFKAKRRNSKNKFFVDASGRKYQNWNDYLENNKLPKCIYCYPNRGRYSTDEDGDVVISFGTSPACDFANRVRDAGDTFCSYIETAIVTIELGGLLGVSFGPSLLSTVTVVKTMTATYRVARSIEDLVDRAKHGESISLSNAEARAHWVTIVSTVLGKSLDVAGDRLSGSIEDATRAGRVASTAGRIAFVVTQTASFTLRGICIAHTLAILVDKYERNELTSLDVYKFTAAVLFYTNDIMDFKTANDIIRETQEGMVRQELVELMSE